MSPSTRAALCAFFMLFAPVTGRAEGILYANPLGVAWHFYSAGFDIIFKHTGHFTFGPVAGYHYYSSSDGVEKSIVYGGRLSYFQNEVLKFTCSFLF